MRTNSVLMKIAAALALLASGLPVVAQQSHIGKLTGNAKQGKELYKRYCIYLPWALRRWDRRKCSVSESQAQGFYQGHLQVPVYSERKPSAG